MTQLSKQSIYFPLLASIILVLGAFLFIRNLDSLSLWVDEGWSVYVADSPQLTDAVELVAEDVHPPLYFVGLYLWRQFTGESVFAYRYLTVLMVLLTGAVIYRVGQALFNRTAGVIALSLYLLHDLILVLGQEIRQYSLAQLLVVVTVWTYWRFIEKAHT